MGKQPYELSLWETYVIPAEGDLPERFGERKKFILASDTSDALCNAYDVTLDENISGEKTLTFSMKYKYYENDKEVDNPYIDYMVNEQKLKLRIGKAYTPQGESLDEKMEYMLSEDDEEKWLDFVIKNVSKSKTENSFDVSAKESFVNELGKNGNAVVLNTELANNSGTLSELGAAVLAGSDWKISEDSYHPVENVAEPLVSAIITQSFTGHNVMTEEERTFEVGKVVYLFYSQCELDDEGKLTIKTDTEIQVLSNENGSRFTIDDVDDNFLVLDDDFDFNFIIDVDDANDYISSLAITGSQDDPGNIYIEGTKIVKQQKTKYFDQIQTFAKAWTVLDSESGAEVGDTVYSYDLSRPSTVEFTQNKLTNTTNFEGTAAWSGKLDHEIAGQDVAVNPTLKLFPYIPIEEVTKDYHGVAYLSLKFKQENTVYSNTGTVNNGLEVTQDEYFVVRIRNRWINNNNGYDFSQEASIEEIKASITRFLSEHSDLQQYADFDLETGKAEIDWDAIDAVDPSTAEGQQTLSDIRSYIKQLETFENNYLNDEQSVMDSNLPDLNFTLCYYNPSTDTETTYGTATIHPYNINSKGTTEEDYAEWGYPEKRLPNNPSARYVPKNDGDFSRTFIDEQGYFYSFMKINQSSRADETPLTMKISINGTVDDYTCCIEDIQLFGYLIGDVSYEDEESETGSSIAENVIVFPKDPVASILKTETKFFYLDNNKEIVNISIDEEYYEPIYELNYEKVRLIEVENSNYFNNIQSLAELFEVWAKFKTYHLKNGEVMYEDGAPKREIIFSKYSPNGDVINYAGFKNGINVANITREVNSDNITTKTIVKNNNQDLAIDMSCSITRSTANPSGEEYIYNFNYYIQQGILSQDQVVKDLYGTEESDFGLYPKLRELNNTYDENANMWSDYTSQFNKLTADKIQYESLVNSYETQMAVQQNDLQHYPVGSVYHEATLLSYENSLALYRSYKELLDKTNESLDYYQTNIDLAQQTMDECTEAKKELNLQFYKKYYQFIQEGTWQDDNYTNDDLYYLDGFKVATTSSQPQVTYTIDTIDINTVEGFEIYNFKVGERTYLEDPTFFGYKFVNIGDYTVKTPKRVEVIVSNYSRNFDDLSRSQITIQTYKNQFEELFQKITAETQQLEYQSGTYERAANVINKNGEIKASYLEKTFNNNAIVLQNSDNQSVVWDTGNGITVTNNYNTDNRVRIIGRGIYITNDGGRTWNLGISGDGINTELLTAGAIDVGKIRLMNGDAPSFFWDENGIKAYKSVGSSYVENEYVNYNQYGIYGADQTNFERLEAALEAAITYEEKLTAIETEASFALTPRGLFMNVGNTRNVDEGVISNSEITGGTIRGASINLTGQNIDGYDETSGNKGNIIDIGNIEAEDITTDSGEIGTVKFSKDETVVITDTVISNANAGEPSSQDNSLTSPLLNVDDKIAIDGNGVIYGAKIHSLETIPDGENSYIIIQGNKIIPSRTGADSSVDRCLVGSSTRRFHNMYADSFVNGSSIRWKQDVKTLTNDDYDISQMRPVTYKFKGDDKEQIGFIAEEMVNCCPDVVDIDEEGIPAGIDYARLTAIAIKEIQSLKEEILILKKEIENLKK